MSKLEAIEKKKAKIEQLQKEVRALSHQSRAEKRRKETRQKIILGGALMAHAKTDEKFQKVINVLKSHLNQKEAELFKE